MARQVGVMDVPPYGGGGTDAWPFWDMRGYATFADAIAAIGATEATLGINSQLDVLADITIPANVTLFFTEGGSLNVDNAITVTINGHIRSELYQIFYWVGTGRVVFNPGSVKEVYPEWWGDDIQAAIDAVANGPKRVKLSGKTYFPAATIYLVNHSVQLIGTGHGDGGTKIDSSSGYAIIAATPSSDVPPYNYLSHCAVRDMWLHSDSALYGISVTGFSYSDFRNLNIEVTTVNGHMIHGVGNNGASPYYNIFDNLVLSSNWAIGSVGIFGGEGAWAGGSNGPNANCFSNIGRICSVKGGIDIRAGNGNTFFNVQLEANSDYDIRLNYRVPDVVETATAGTYLTLVHAGAGWTINAYVHAGVKIVGGAGAGQTNTVKTNTADTLTMERPFLTTPDNTSQFEVYLWKAGGQIFNGVRVEGSGTDTGVLFCAGSGFNSVMNAFISSVAAEMTREILNEITDTYFPVGKNYIEGTWTPVRHSFTEVMGGGTITNTGHYTKIGRLVVMTATIVCAGGATIAAVSASSYLSGMPFIPIVYGSGTWANRDSCATGGIVLWDSIFIYTITAWAAASEKWTITVMGWV